MGLGLPYARPNQVIGLLGGSFDPAHAGHVHITREALKRFGLDHVWWLVTPGNPLGFVIGQGSLGLTMGQLLSLPMVVLGLALATGLWSSICARMDTMWVANNLVISFCRIMPQREMG